MDVERDEFEKTEGYEKQGKEVEIRVPLHSPHSYFVSPGETHA